MSLPDGARHWACHLLAFGSGFGVLVLELAGARHLAGTYGLSSIPWTAVIATVLAGLALGNWVGGVIADRDRASLVPLFLLAGLWALVPVFGTEWPDQLMLRIGFLEGVLASSALFFFVPSVLMGTVTPILVRLLTERVEEVGLRFGDVGAWSTAGAILGTLVTGLVLIPSVELSVVFASVSGLFLLCAGVGGVVQRCGWRQVLAGPVLLPLLVVVTRSMAPGGDVVFRGQSLYASLAVVDTEWYGDVPARELWQNGSLSSVEHRISGAPLHRYQIALGRVLEDRVDRIESVLVLGGAANTFPAQLARWAPHLDITVVEIDPMAVQLASDFFSYGRLEPGSIRMVIEDARPFLRRDRRDYDVILVDAYDHLYSVPWPLMTGEALVDIERRLREGGVVAFTFSTALAGPGSRFLERMVATIESRFGAVRIYPTRPEIDPTYTQEVIVVTARDETDLSASARDVHWVRVPPAGTPFRDDFAPVEFLQALRFLSDPEW